MSVWAARNAARLAGLAAAAALVAAGPRHSRAQPPAEVEGLPIRSLGIVARDIYEPLPPGRLRPLYRLANSLHVRTRASTVRSQLLFRPGDPWSESRARESERQLRTLGILEPGRLEARRVRDSVDVVLETRDDWTTQPEFAIQSANGESFTSVSLIEQNVLGLGKSVSLSYREAPEGIVRSAAYSDPNVLGSRLRFTAQGGVGTEGASQGFEAGVPFYAEDTPYSYGARWGLVTSVAHLFQAGEEAAAFDRRIEETEILWGRGWKRPAGVVRLTGTFLVRDRRFGDSRAETGAPEAFAGGEENLHVRRLGGEARWWRPSFVERTGVDHLGGIEDIDLGHSVRLLAGFSPRWLGGTADEGFLGTRLDGGVSAGPRSFGIASVELKTRLRREPAEGISRAQGRWVSQFRRHHALVIAGYGAAAYRPSRDFQVILGGLNGLRAVPVRGLTGHQAWRFNVEHRWWVGHDFLQLLSIGSAGFYDLGRTWGPGATDRQWRQDVGIGLRIALPRSGQDRVARIDLAWPVARGPGDPRGPVVSLGSGQAF